MDESERGGRGGAGRGGGWRRLGVWRWPMGIVAVLAALGFLLSAAFFIAGPRVTTAWLLHRAADLMGAPAARFDVTDVRWRKLGVANLRAGPLQARRLEVEFGPFGPFGGIAAGVIEGLKVDVDLSAPGGGAGTPAVPNVPVLPFPLTLRDAVIALEGPSETYRATARGPVRLSRSESAGLFDLAIHPKDGASGIQAHSGQLEFKMTPQQAPTVALALAPDGKPDPAHAGVSVYLRLDGGAPSTLSLSLKDLRLPALGDQLKALTLHGTVSYAEGRLALRLADCARLEGLSIKQPGRRIEADSLPVCPVHDADPVATMALDDGGKEALTTALILRGATGRWLDATGAPVISGVLPTLSVAGTSDKTFQHWQGAIATVGGAAGDGNSEGNFGGGGALSGPGGLALSGLALKAKLAASGAGPVHLDADLTRAVLSGSGPTPLIVPVTLTGTAKTDGDAIRLALDGAAAGLPALLHAEGAHQLKSGAGTLRFTFGPLHLDPQGLTPAKLSPALGAQITEARGQLSAEGVYGWGASASASQATLRLQELEAKGPAVRLAGVAGTIAFSGLAPLKTAGIQSLRVALLDAGLPLTDGVLHFSLLPSGELRLQESRWSWLGGTAGLSTGSFKAGRAAQSVTFVIDKVDLGALLALADVKGLSGSGRISGRLPVTIEGTHQRVTAGQIAADAPGGQLSYKTGQASRNPANPSAVLYTALDNFLYDSLVADISGDLAGTLSLEVHLKGHNPDLYDGRRIELNITTAGPFVDMLRKGLSAYRTPVRP